MNVKTQLLPCPFCGKLDSVMLVSVREDDGKDYYDVVCSVQKGGCGASSGYVKVRSTAYNQWNRRANLVILDRSYETEN